MADSEAKTPEPTPAKDRTREGPATDAVVANSRLAGDQSPEGRLAQSESNAPIGTTTTGAVPGGILDPNNKTIIHPSPEGDGPARDEANTAARDQELATDGTREAEAALGTGAAPEDDDGDPDKAAAAAEAAPAARPKRDRSATPDKVREWVENEQKSQAETLVLTRAGHFHAGNGEEGRCWGATVTGVTKTEDGEPDLVTLRVYPSGQYDVIPGTGAGPGEVAQPTGIPFAKPSDKADVNTFHFSRQCPWHR